MPRKCGKGREEKRKRKKKKNSNLVFSADSAGQPTHNEKPIFY
jgi:hypothetical protein